MILLLNTLVIAQLSILNGTGNLSSKKITTLDEVKELGEPTYSEKEGWIIESTNIGPLAWVGIIGVIIIIIVLVTIVLVEVWIKNSKNNRREKKQFSLRKF